MIICIFSFDAIEFKFEKFILGRFFFNLGPGLTIWFLIGRGHLWSFLVAYITKKKEIWVYSNIQIDIVTKNYKLSVFNFISYREE